MPSMSREGERRERGERHISCACSVNFSLIRETAGRRLRRFPAQESRSKRSRRIRWKKQWFGYSRQPFFSFFLLLLKWKQQSLNIIVRCVEGSYFQNAKDCTNDFESCLVIVWAIDVDDVIFEGCKWPVEEHKRIG